MNIISNSILLLVLFLQDPVGKELPKVETPDWQVWNSAPSENVEKSLESWNPLLRMRPDRKRGTRQEERDLSKRMNELYAELGKDLPSACAAAASLLKNTRDSFELAMLSNYLYENGGKEGSVAKIWAFSKVTSIESIFRSHHQDTARMAQTGDLKYLPAVITILNVQSANLYLPMHHWTIRTHEALFYVLGRYDQRVLPYLYPMLKNDNPFVKRNAAFVLGQFCDRNAKPLLLKMLETDDVGAGGAAFALGAIGAKESAVEIARLLKSKLEMNRFWAAYALYEFSSKDGLAALKAAEKVETKEIPLQEIRVAIESIESGGMKYPKPASPMTEEAFISRLDELENENGLEIEREDILHLLHADPKHIAQIERIRRKTITIPSDYGNKRFKIWSKVVQAVRRRIP